MIYSPSCKFFYEKLLRLPQPQDLLELEMADVNSWKRSKIIILFAESSIERVPPSILRHPSVLASAKRYGKDPSKLLLDRAYHHHAMLKMRDSHKRGRPDILHFCLLESLGSILARKGMLEVYVSTYDGRTITVDSSTRLPRVYDRFKGLIEDLYERKVIRSDGHTLLRVEEKPLAELIRSINPSIVIGTSEDGKSVTPTEVAEIALGHSRAMIVVGAFPKGAYSLSTVKLFDATYSIYPRPLEAWTVTSRILCSLENKLLHRA